MPEHAPHFPQNIRPIPAPRHRTLTLACLAGSLLAVTLGLGPSQPDTSTEIIVRKLEGIDDKQNRILLELAEGRREIRETRELVTSLRDELRSLRTELGEVKKVAGGQTKPTEPAPPADPIILPKEPLGSPDALFATLRERYQKAFAEALPNNEVAHRERQRDIERWCREINHELRGKMRWLVRVDSFKEITAEAAAQDREKYPEGPGWLANYTILDAVSRNRVSSPLAIRVPSHLAAKLRSHPEGTLAEVGVFIASEVVYSPTRVEPGIFGLPIMVGPYVEYAFRVEWTSVEPIRDSSKPDRSPNDPPR